MAYRNVVDALEARLAAVQRDLDTTTRDRDETARMLGEARDRVRNEDLAADYAAGGPQRRRRSRLARGAGSGHPRAVGVVLNEAMHAEPDARVSALGPASPMG